jgi:hypothetical protein
VGTLLAGLFNLLLKPLIDGVITWLQGRQARADEIALGQQQQKATDETAAVDAQRRMDQAGEAPRDDRSTSDSLRGGRF